jgi:stage III sporulation protein AD
MDIYRVVLLAVGAVALLVVLRQLRKEYAVALSIVAGIAIFGMILGKFGLVVEALSTLAGKSSIGELHIKTLLKILGIAYLTEVAAQVSRDAGETAVAGQVEMAGKILILALGIPIVILIVDTVLGLI